MRFSISILVVGAFLGAVLFSLTKSPPTKVLGWDNFGYQLYLPATFIRHDLKIASLHWPDSLRTKYDLSGTLYQLHRSENGNHVNQYSCGWSVMMLPAFLTAHFLAEPLGYEVDGFSKPYNHAAWIYGWICLAVGLFVLRKVLREFFSEGITAIVLALLCFGTNLWFMALQATASPHILLFMLYAFVLWFTIQWHKSGKSFHLLALAFSCGLACLVRPSEIVCILIPLLWNVVSWPSFKTKMKWLFAEQRKKMMLFAAILFLCALPQLLYWKHVTGSFLFMSYTNPGEGFDFLSPHTFDFLFSFRKGWLVYTPLAVFMIAGIWFLRKKIPTSFVAVLIFFIANLYIISSWSTWWYAGSFSSRAIVQSYPVLILALASLVSCIVTQLRWASFLAPVAMLLTVLNVFQTWQANHYGIIDTDRMTWPAYKSVFLKTQKPDGLDSLLLVNRSFEGKNEIRYRHRYSEETLAQLSFDSNGKNFVQKSDSIFHLESGSALMNDSIEFLNGFVDVFRNITEANHIWIEAEVWVFANVDISPNLKMACAMKHGGGQYGLQYEEFDSAFVAGAWNKLRIQWLTPEIRSRRDRLFVYLWYTGEEEIRVDDFEVTALVPQSD